MALPTSREQGFVPCAEAIERLFAEQCQGTRRVRSLILCYPNNPTGACLSEAQAKALCDVLERVHKRHYDQQSASFSVILDEVYVGITQTSPAHVSLFQYASEELRKRMFLVLSCSKGLGAMPGGWRAHARVCVSMSACVCVCVYVCLCVYICV